MPHNIDRPSGSPRWAYYQLRMDEESRPLTAFKTPLGSFTWNVMPMGVPNAPAAFQRLMDSMFRDLPFVSCYFDDVVIHSHSAEEHLRHLAIVFERLHQHSLLTRLNKCKTIQKSIQFLGHIIDGTGVHTDPEKLQAVQQCPTQQSVCELQSFLSLCNYYSKFVNNFTKIAAQLTDLLKATSGSALREKKPPRLAWEASHTDAFAALKRALCSAPCLQIFNPQAKCFVAADACD